MDRSLQTLGALGVMYLVCLIAAIGRSRAVRRRIWIALGAYYALFLGMILGVKLLARSPPVLLVLGSMAIGTALALAVAYVGSRMTNGRTG